MIVHGEYFEGRDLVAWVEWHGYKYVVCTARDPKGKQQHRYLSDAKEACNAAACGIIMGRM